MGYSKYDDSLSRGLNNQLDIIKKQHQEELGRAKMQLQQAEAQLKAMMEHNVEMLTHSAIRGYTGYSGAQGVRGMTGSVFKGYTGSNNIRGYTLGTPKIYTFEEAIKHQNDRVKHFEKEVNRSLFNLDEFIKFKIDFPLLLTRFFIIAQTPFLAIPSLLQSIYFKVTGKKNDTIIDKLYKHWNKDGHDN